MPDAKTGQFKIGSGDRVFIVGTTGSGKTSLSKALLYGLDNVVILDPKGTFTLPQAWKHSTHQTLQSLTSQRGPETLIYRPPLLEADAGCPDFFEWVFERRNTFLYVDEVMRVTNGTTIGKSYATVLQLGRERGIATWNATQRPANIPLVIMTESEHYFVFRLRNVADRKRLVDYTGADEFMQLPRDEHGFYYYNDRTGKITYYRRAKLGKVDAK